MGAFLESASQGTRLVPESMSHEQSNAMEPLPQPHPGQRAPPRCLPPRGAASCHPQKQDGPGDPASYPCLDLRQPVNPTGPRGEPAVQMGGPAQDLPKSRNDTESQHGFLTPFCSSRPMPRFPTRESPRPPHPPPPAPCGVISAYGCQSSRLFLAPEGERAQLRADCSADLGTSQPPACTPQPSRSSMGRLVAGGPLPGSPS